MIIDVFGASLTRVSFTSCASHLVACYVSMNCLIAKIELPVYEQTSESKNEVLGMVSGYMHKVPESKTKAAWKEMLATPTGLSFSFSFSLSLSRARSRSLSRARALSRWPCCMPHSVAHAPGCFSVSEPLWEATISSADRGLVRLTCVYFLWARSVDTAGGQGREQ
jgi:hypothetical protein